MEKTSSLGRISYLLFFIVLPFVAGELPSCYRARCSHCTVELIAKMCPVVCGGCNIDNTGVQGPRIRPGRPNANSAINGNTRVHGTSITNNAPIYSSQSTLQRGLYSSNAETHVGNSASRSAPPTAQQLPEVATPTIQTPYNAYQNIPQQQQYSQNYYQPQQQQQQQSQLYTNQQPQQQYLLQQQPQTTSYGSSYSTNYANPPASGNTPQQYGSYVQNGQQQNSGIFPQQQQSLFPQQQLSQLYNGAPQPQTQQYYGQTQPAAPSQSYNIFQPQPSPNGGATQTSSFINPFSPFLQQSFQAQQQAPFFQPFTPIPPPPPMIPALGTPATPLGSVPQPSSSSANGPISSLPPPAPMLPSFSPIQPMLGSTGPAQQPTFIQPPAQQIPYAQQIQQTTDVQRPKQIYAPQPQQIPQMGQAQAFNVPQQNQQLASNAVVPVVPSGAAANSIDTSPEYVNKNSFGDKSGGQLLTCPKQPNWEPCISKEVANERFRNCCQRLGDGCSQLCSYDSTLATIQIAVLTGRCPLGKVADMMICASGNEDASACCQAYNVFEPGFEHCRPYCNPAAGLPNDGMLAEKYRCLGKLSQIQRCFYVTQKP